MKETRILQAAAHALVVWLAACSSEPLANAVGRSAVDDVLVAPNGSQTTVEAFWTYDLTRGRWSTSASAFSLAGGRALSFWSLTGNTADGSAVGAGSAAVDTTISALIAGGRARAALATADAALYTGQDPKWVRLTMTTPRIEHDMAEIAGQRVLIVGGYGTTANVPLTSAEIFTLSTRSFAATGSLHIARADHALATLPDGRVLVIGGLTPSGAGTNTVDVASTEIFNPANGVFSDGPLMTVPRFNHSAITLNDGRVLVLGGNDKRSAEVYTPTSNRFTAIGDMFAIHGRGHVALELPNGRILVTGGDMAVNQPTSIVEQFDPVANVFTTVGNMTTARMLHFAVLLPDGKVLIGGGRGTSGAELASAEIYDPATNTAVRIADMPGTTADQAAALIRVPGRR